jgi:hypothetical protein
MRKLFTAVFVLLTMTLMGQEKKESSAVVENNPLVLENNNGKKILVLPTDLDGKHTWTLAKDACKNLSASGYDDWYLPSRKELTLLFERKDDIGNLKHELYWSSDDYTHGYAWLMYMHTGKIYAHEYNDPAYVRCIRKD